MDFGFWVLDLPAAASRGNGEKEHHQSAKLVDFAMPAPFGRPFPRPLRFSGFPAAGDRLGFRIFDFRFWILGFGFGFWILGFGFWFWVLDFEFWILGFGFLVLVLVLGFWFLGFGFWVLGIGFWVLDFGFGL